MRRKLVLQKETLAELTAGDLAGIAGAQATPNCPQPPTNWCETLRPVYCQVSRIVDPCATLPASCIC